MAIIIDAKEIASKFNDLKTGVNILVGLCPEQKRKFLRRSKVMSACLVVRPV